MYMKLDLIIIRLGSKFFEKLTGTKGFKKFIELVLKTRLKVLSKTKQHWWFHAILSMYVIHGKYPSSITRKKEGQKNGKDGLTVKDMCSPY